LPTERRRSNSRGSLRIVSGLAENTHSIFCDGPPGPETANGCPVLRRQEPTAERHRARSSEARVRRTLFPLDKDLRRPTGSYHCSDAAWPASTVEIQFRAPLQAHWRRRPGRIAGFPATPFAIKRQNRALFGFVRIKRVQVGHLQDLILRHTCTISNSPRTLCVLVGQRPTGEILPLRRPEGVTRRNQDLALGRVVLWIQKITRNPLVSLYVQ